MDAFDALMTEVSHRAQDDDTSFSTALTSALSEEQSSEPSVMPEAAAQPLQADAAGVQAPDMERLITLEHLAMAVRMIVPVELKRTLLADGWAANTGDSDYPYAYSVESPHFVTDRLVKMYVDLVSSSAAWNAEIAPGIEKGSGMVRVLAKQVPTADIAVTFIISPVIQVS